MWLGWKESRIMQTKIRGGKFPYLSLFHNKISSINCVPQMEELINEGRKKKRKEKRKKIRLRCCYGTFCGGSQRQIEIQRGGIYCNTPLPELLLGEQFFCLVVCRDSFIQGKICLASVGLGGSEEEDDVEDDVEEEELDDLLGSDLETADDLVLPPGC